MMLAYEVMTTRIAGIHPRATLGQAISLMADLGVTTLPVVDVSGRLVGMLTSGDILRRTQIGHAQDGDDGFYGAAPASPFASDGFAISDDAEAHIAAQEQRVEEVMTSELCVVQEHTPVAEVARLVKDRAIKRLPVLHGDKLVGIINRADLMHALGEDFDGELGAATPQDSAIKDAVRGVLHRLKWTPSPLIDVIVEAGQIELHGTLLRESEREALRIAIENIPGVTGVADHLVLAEPLSGLLPGLPHEMARRQKLYC